ncbi:hypothetical protein [Streptomyces sp. ISL-11]|uniref:hypothetical protein n=1 Tax=Streptomyces sp. ISL-11 TaxID=2819174 RepID=UPI001BE7921D|nr:hypothetical protein [Streptomyces sp. ISL-11]MBT2384543.1 hypothetical protein [Streptomyces sp. ISL-11]
MTEPIDQALSRARLRHRPCAVTEHSEARLSARIAERMWWGALRFDDQMEPARTAAVRTTQRDALPHRAFHRHLRILCETVISQDLYKLGAFLARRILEPDGALVLGCVLQLADREDSARFWWQFAAGAGDNAAACCLYLHHMALGERREADLWHRHAGLEDHIPKVPESLTRNDLDTALRILDNLREGASTISPAATAVIAYVPDAVGYVEEVDLPLPAPDFAARIEELTATA